MFMTESLIDQASPLTSRLMGLCDCEWENVVNECQPGGGVLKVAFSVGAIFVLKLALKSFKLNFIKTFHFAAPSKCNQQLLKNYCN